MCGKDLKANGRGSFDFQIDLNSSFRLIKWYDNKAVISGFTFSSIQSTSDKQCWDVKKKEHCKINYPNMTKDYNQNMGGVDLNDMLISLYRVDIQSRMQWYLKIITHLLNIVMLMVGFCVGDILTKYSKEKAAHSSINHESYS